LNKLFLVIYWLNIFQNKKKELSININKLVFAIESIGINPTIKEKLAENQARLSEIENQIQQVSQCLKLPFFIPFEISEKSI